MTRRSPVRAAGGVVWRPGPAGIEVCLIHRQRYDDWSLPKGKLHRGEHPLIGAAREVAEETGVAGVPQVRLPSVGYRLAGGVDKTVDYWLMRAVDGPDFAPNDEVDAVAWVPLAEAAGRLSYTHDVEVMRQAVELPGITAVVVFLRHGCAGERDAWDGPDQVRPLDDQGRAQAAALADLLTVFRPERLVSATPDRCAQTLEPLATRLGTVVAREPAFDALAPAADAVTRLRELAGRLPASVVSSQGELIPRALAGLLGQETDRYVTDKAEGWLLAFDGDNAVAVDRLSCPPLD